MNDTDNIPLLRLYFKAAERRFYKEIAEDLLPVHTNENTHQSNNNHNKKRSINNDDNDDNDNDDTDDTYSQNIDNQGNSNNNNHNNNDINNSRNDNINNDNDNMNHSQTNNDDNKNSTYEKSNIELDEKGVESDFLQELNDINTPGVYLTAFHVYCLANLLRRPIIVYGDIPKGDNRMRGIYLPTMYPPEETYPFPLTVLYTAKSGHFTAVLSPSADHIDPDTEEININLPLSDQNGNILSIPYGWIDPTTQEYKEALIHGLNPTIGPLSISPLPHEMTQNGSIPQEKTGKNGTSSSSIHDQNPNQSIRTPSIYRTRFRRYVGWFIEKSKNEIDDLGCSSSSSSCSNGGGFGSQRSGSGSQNSRNNNDNTNNNDNNHDNNANDNNSNNHHNINNNNHNSNHNDTHNLNNNNHGYNEHKDDGSDDESTMSDLEEYDQDYGN
jgi:hypothetical protein